MARAHPWRSEVDLRSLENAGEVEAGELADPAIGIEDFRFAVFGSVPRSRPRRKRTWASRWCSTVAARHAPKTWRPAVALSMIATRYQRTPAEPGCCRGDVGAPDQVGPVDHQVPQQIRVNPVFRVGIAGSWRLIDDPKMHDGPSNASDAERDDGRCKKAFAAQLTHHLPGAS